MRQVKLNELCEINIGKTPSRANLEYWGKGSKWVSISDMKSKFIYHTKEEITDIAVNECNMKLVSANTVIMSFKLSIGKVAITCEDLFTNEAIASFPIKDRNTLDKSFLYYALQTLDLIKNTDRAVMGATLNKSKLNKIEIPLPPIETQKKIAEVLDKAQELIDKRKEQIALLDDFIQSVFIDMFGDPVSNPKGWEEKRIVDCCNNNDDIKCGPFGTQLSKSEYQIKGVPLWGISQINSQFRTRPVDFLTLEKAEKLSAYSIEENDIVMSRKGTVGKCALYPKDFPNGIMHSDVLRIRVEKSVASPTFLCYQLRLSKKIDRQIEILSQGAIMAGINVGKLKSILILVPPLDLQNQFAQIVEKTEQQRELLEKSLVEMENNFNSIMQRAFRGELF